MMEGILASILSSISFSSTFPAVDWADCEWSSFRASLASGLFDFCSANGMFS
jgi:hypothetical protein